MSILYEDPAALHNKAIAKKAKQLGLSVMHSLYLRHCIHRCRTQGVRGGNGSPTFLALGIGVVMYLIIIS